MKCNYCEWRCELSDGQSGVCGMYTQQEGVIRQRFPDRYTTYMAVHIESIPFFHAYPGSRSLLIGSCGCNFDCHYCINAYVAKGNPQDMFMFELKPKKIVDIAKKTGCHNIVFGVNEVTVALPSMTDLSREAKTAGIPMGCMTNGYMTEESAEMIAECFQFINISLKSMSQGFYKKYTGINDFKPVLRNIKTLAKTCHIEITTPIIQSVNDDEIMDIAGFIHDVNPEIPWHVFRLLPEYKMNQYDYPNIDEINKSLEKARKIIPFIYFSNFVGSDWVNTLCPDCGNIVIERINFGGCGGKIINYSLDNGSCPSCGKRIPLCGDYINWNSEDIV
jgi:AmmeMemoRadiSam system radical SAM enzyme